MQAVGRSGRKNKAGEAIIQTYQPEHYAITLAARQDYEMFYKKEMQLRKASNYPPYCYLASITLSGKNEEKVVETAYLMNDDLTNKFSDETVVLGPITPFIPYMNDTYKRSILIKYRDVDNVNKVLKSLIKAIIKTSGISVHINIDPYDF